MSWLERPARSGTDVDERVSPTQPLPAGRPPSAEGVQLVGAPTDPYGDRAPIRPVERPPRVVPRTVWFFVVVGVLIVTSALAADLVMGGLANLNPFKNGLITQRTVDRSGPAVLKAVTDLGTLQSASGYYEIVIDVEKSVDNVPSLVAGRRTLFVAAGTVDAAVDMRGLGSGDVTVNQARTAATIRLPKPQLSPPRLDLTRSHVYSQERGLIDRVYDAVNGSPADQQQQLYTLAERRLTQAAQANDELTKRAEANTRTTLQSLLHPLGFTDVTVEFAG